MTETENINEILASQIVIVTHLGLKRNNNQMTNQFSDKPVDIILLCSYMRFICII